MSRGQKRKFNDDIPPEPIALNPKFRWTPKPIPKSKADLLLKIKSPPPLEPISEEAAEQIELQEAAKELHKQARKLEVAANYKAARGIKGDGIWYKNAYGHPVQTETPAPVSYAKSTGQRNLEAAMKGNKTTGKGAYYGLGKYVTQQEADEYFAQQMAKWAPPEEEQWGDTFWGKAMTGFTGANKGGEGIAAQQGLDTNQYHAQKKYRDMNRKAIEDEMKGGTRHRYSGWRDFNYDEYKHKWWGPRTKEKDPRAWKYEKDDSGLGYWQLNKLITRRQNRKRGPQHGPGPENQDFAFGRGSYKRRKYY